ncbi:phage tail assembly chaperone [Yunchengibacter salinarum]|uniref:phage tail assembly chaperone n=1 Tax=Yunchengibacter salinarum TaxID=3133399 RepID=UPI0035B62F07
MKPDPSGRAVSWSALMELAGMLGWSPDTLARATLPELLAHLRGWQRAHGIDPDGAAPMDRPTLSQLMQRYPDMMPDQETPDDQTDRDFRPVDPHTEPAGRAAFAPGHGPRRARQ